MAQQKRPATRAPVKGRPGARPPAPRGPSASAERRYARSHRSRSSSLGWAFVAVVVVAILVIVIVHFAGSSGSSSANQSSGQHPAAAPASLTSALAAIPASSFDSVGIDGQTSVFTVTKNQALIGTASKPLFVYFGAEYCPYCAMMRWPLTAALDRFGHFSGLKVTTSASDEDNIETLSFLGAKYTSPYLTFSSTEYLDRNSKALEPVSALVGALVSKYSYPPFTTVQAESGIPFLDVANRYVSSGVPGVFLNLIPFLQNGAVNRAQIVAAMANPNSVIGKDIQVKLFLSQANYITAAICLSDKMQPSSVCKSAGVTPAIAALEKATKVS